MNPKTPDDAVAYRAQLNHRPAREPRFVPANSYWYWEEQGYRQTGAVMDVSGTELIEIELPPFED